MASRHRHEPDSLEPLREGEFRRISGIGPGIEQRLHTAGIKTFQQLAALSTDEILTLLYGIVGVTRERVQQQDWPAQARRFANDLLVIEKVQEAEEPGERQHYESFMLELLLDEDHHVRRTRVVHVQNSEKDSWVGWEPWRMFGWVASQAGLPATEGKLDGQAHVELPRPRMFLSGKLTLQDVSVASHETGRMSQFFTTEEPFDLQMTIDPSQLEIPEEMAVRCRVVASARMIGYAERVSLGQKEQMVSPNEPIVTNMTVAGLRSGTYLLQAEVTAYPAGSETPEVEGTSLIVDGGLVQVQSPVPEPFG